MLTYPELKLTVMTTPQPNSNKAANWVKKNGYGKLLQLAFDLEKGEITQTGMQQSISQLESQFPEDNPLARGMIITLIKAHLVVYGENRNSIIMTRKACELLRHHGHPSERPQRELIEQSGPIRLIYKKYPGLKRNRYHIEIDMLTFEVRNEKTWEKMKKAMQDPRFHERYDEKKRQIIEADARRFYEKAMQAQFALN